jgi:dTMP kinase
MNIPMNLGYKGLVNTSENESNQLKLSSIPKGETSICNIIYNKDAYSQHCKDYNEYAERSWIGDYMLQNVRDYVLTEGPRGSGNVEGEKIDAALIFYHDKLTKNYWVSVRSVKGTKHALVIAKNFGGSGNDAAAGFSIKENDPVVELLFTDRVNFVKTRDMSINTDITVAPKRRGKFILFEGIDKSGKTSTAKCFVTKLPNSEYIKFPDRTTEIGKIIDNCLRKKEKLPEAALKMLFIANRFELKSFIEKKLDEGINIVCDRYYLSNIVYNDSAVWFRPDILKDADSIQTLIEDINNRVNSEFIDYLPKPDIIFFLLSPDVKELGDELYETRDVLDRVQDNYRKFIAVSEQENGYSFIEKYDKAFVTDVIKKTDIGDDIINFAVTGSIAEVSGQECGYSFVEKYFRAFDTDKIRKIKLGENIINFVVIGSVDGEDFAAKKTDKCLKTYHSV